MRRLTPKEILAESFRELAANQSISKITVKDIAEKGKRCCLIIANRAIVRQHLNYFFMQQSLIAVYNKPIYAIDEETVKRYPVGTITESGNGS